MSQPIKVDFFYCANICLVVVLPVLCCWYVAFFFNIFFLRSSVDDLLHVELLPGIPVASPHNIYEGQRCSEC